MPEVAQRRVGLGAYSGTHHGGRYGGAEPAISGAIPRLADHLGQHTCALSLGKIRTVPFRLPELDPVSQVAHTPLRLAKDRWSIDYEVRRFLVLGPAPRVAARNCLTIGTASAARLAASP